MPRRKSRTPLSDPPLPLEHSVTSPRSQTTSFTTLAGSGLLAASALVAARFEDDDVWKESPFVWVRNLPPATRARAAESIISEMLTSAGFLVQPRVSSGHDRLVEGSKVRVKFSTRWTSGSYTFQQVRPGDFEFLVLFGLSPQEGHAWVVPSDVALPLARRNSWIAVDPTAPPSEIVALGGPIDHLASHVSQVIGGPTGLNVPGSGAD